jgi:hypothetical protein
VFGKRVRWPLLAVAADFEVSVQCSLVVDLGFVYAGLDEALVSYR